MDKGRTVTSGSMLSYSADREAVQKAQSINVAKLLEKHGKEYIHSSESHEGVTLRTDGCIGHIRFTNMNSLNIVPRFDGLKRYDDGEIYVAMLSRVFGLDIVSPISNMLEFFFRLFLVEVSELTKMGLRSEYQKVQQNGTQFKGRVLFSQNIRKNYIRKDRIFVEFTKYTLDRVENRLIKKALMVVGKFTVDPYNKALSVILLKFFENVSESDRPKADYSSVRITRDLESYIMPLRWANAILNDMELIGNTAMKKPVAVLMDSVDLMSAYVASKSIEGRTGRYQYDFSVEKIKGSSSTDPVIMIIKPKWRYFDKVKGRDIDDPIYLFNTASGYAVMPANMDADPRGERRLAFMVEQYLVADLMNIRKKNVYVGST